MSSSEDYDPLGWLATHEYELNDVQVTNSGEPDEFAIFDERNEHMATVWISAQGDSFVDLDGAR